jgi:B-cell receptor-associated protein 31
MPNSFRRRLFKAMSNSALLARIEYVLKILFVFVFILFLDSLNRMWRTQAEIESRERMPDIRTDTNLYSKMFYNQRNMYLTGLTRSYSDGQSIHRTTQITRSERRTGT